MATNIDLINEALVLIGADEISALGDGTTEADTASRLYERILENKLSSYDWQWATEEIDLGAASATETLTDNWTTVHDLPADPEVLRIVNLHHGGQDYVDYRRFADKIFTNLDPTAEPTLWAVVDQDEADFAAYFEGAFVYELAWAFAGAITENDEVRERIEAARRDAWSVAFRADYNGAPPRKAPLGRFARARR